MPNKTVSIFIGQEEDTFEDFLYVETTIAGMEILIYKSTENVSNGSEEDFMSCFEMACNYAKKFAEEIGFKVIVDESVWESATEFSENFLQKLMEVRKELK